MSIKVKKGDMIKVKIFLLGRLHDEFIAHYQLRNKLPHLRVELYMIINKMKEEKNNYNLWMSTMKKSFNDNYIFDDYLSDLRNIKHYYTQWNREDIYKSKESLKRVRKFEKREGIEPFEVREWNESKNIKNTKFEKFKMMRFSSI